MSGDILVLFVPSKML